MDNTVHLAPIIRDLAVILGVAAIVTFIFRRIRQPVVLGYIIAGVIVGPFTPEVFSVTDMPNIQVWAELGVIFLMFALGLEFSFRKLAKVGLSASVTALIQILFMIAFGFGFGRFVGWSGTDSIFLGCMVAISSTTIIIKAVEELGLKTRRFVQMVFAILVVEDLAAILILVALSSFALQASFAGLDLLVAVGKLVLVVGGWFLIGMFVVPRFVTSVRKYGDSEMLTVVSVGLCLALVTVSANFHYSVALGAFIMGSILAETAEAERIEGLVRPLKDVFGAIFFVSVGMMMNPHVLVEHLGIILSLTAVIVIGKIFSITIGSLLTGQTIGNAVRTGFSMGQIGEFSFIIAALGLSYEIISETLYPIIVSASLVTTFTTPYLIRVSSKVVDAIERTMPPKVRQLLDRYAAVVQRYQGGAGGGSVYGRRCARWLANAIVVIMLFVFDGKFLLPLLKSRFDEPLLARGIGWLVAFACSAPFLWGMFQAFKNLSAGGEISRNRDPRKWGIFFASRLLTIILVGILSIEFLPLWLTLLLTVIVASLLFIVFKRQVETFYQWFEVQFRSGFQAGKGHKADEALNRLAPWDAHLVSVTVHPNSPFVAQRLIDLQLKERHGLNVVVIQRGTKAIVAPKANEILLPNDQLLFLGTDEQLDAIRTQVEKPVSEDEHSLTPADYQLKAITIRENSPLKERSILQSGIREQFNSLVVGIERGSERIFNPKSDHIVNVNDVLWVVIPAANVQSLVSFLEGKAN